MYGAPAPVGAKKWPRGRELEVFPHEPGPDYVRASGGLGHLAPFRSGEREEGWRAGKQAEVLNILLAEIIEGHPVSSQRLKEVLGHTPRQVIRTSGVR